VSSKTTSAVRPSPPRASTGIVGLDDILGGGLPTNHLYLLDGEPGTGKTTLAMQFLLAGVERGQRGLYITLSESRAELAEVAASHGWSIDGLDVFELAPDEEATDEGYTLFHPSEIELQQTMDAVLAAVERNEEWRGKRCINLLAPEAPTSPTVRRLLASEIGTRAAEGHIGRVNRWFAGTQYIDEVEALCVELLKKAFRANYADHRLMGSMLGNMAVYHALVQPGDHIMTAAQPLGGHSSNRADGPAGTRGHGLRNVRVDEVPMRAVAPCLLGLVVALPASAQVIGIVRGPVPAWLSVVDPCTSGLYAGHAVGGVDRQAGVTVEDPLADGGLRELGRGVAEDGERQHRSGENAQRELRHQPHGGEYRRARVTHASFRACE
jgi:RecA/RadA recombinase